MTNPLEKQIKNAQRVVVLVIDENGDGHGWEVFGPDASYQITGYPGGSAHGTVRVAGEFHRAQYGQRTPNIMDVVRDAELNRTTTFQYFGKELNE
jgi:hypothetical protein